ncbi:ATP-grasp domain-containing protein [Pedobacter aquatilis]|uniref:ATP-grasp domain-containing protein n=1 Tax=Pedobacter aquatilis TaxID=351343 RepID=UPI00292F19E1|nr:ATP-grasp domain-containing protein [Pedobacter aquatilis]
MSDTNFKVAVLYQAKQPPVKDGILKPIKPGGYADSGADIAYTLKEKNIPVITPTENPEVEQDLDWVFPDTKEGISKAISLGANTFWLNTVLYNGHPIEEFISKDIFVVGQDPKMVDTYDDKVHTNNMLKKANLPIPKSMLIDSKNIDKLGSIDLKFPLMIKPIRGRGSQGVMLVEQEKDLEKNLKETFKKGDFGMAVYLEEYLPGEELTVTIMPPGKYIVEELELRYDYYWALPAVRRFNHENGVAPYNGQVAIINNSEVLTVEEEIEPKVKSLYKLCQHAAEIVHSKAPIRIDCRADDNGQYFLFDLNMKPNMTGAGRMHRADQDSLAALSARRINWEFSDLLTAMLAQRWNSES